MQRLLSLGFLFIWCMLGRAQITVQISTLPDVGDVLAYRAIPVDSLAKVDNQVFLSGPNQQWDFANLESGVEFMETYNALSSGTVADSFPNADLGIEFLGLNGFAKRNTTDISILGVAGDSVIGLPIPIVAQLANPFVIRRAPFAYEDQFNTITSFGVTLGASELDSIQFIQDVINGIPGTTIDSLRATLNINRMEQVDGWGSVVIPSGMTPCLKMTQTDVVTTIIEVYAITFAGSGWVDLSPFLPMDLQDLLTVTSTNYQFYAENSKAVIAEFTVAPDSTLLSARYASDISAGIFESNFKNLIEVNVYPNPTSDFISIDLHDDGGLRNMQLELYDVEGKQIVQRLIDSDLELDVSKLISGMYFLSLKDKGKLLFRSTINVLPKY